MSTIGSPSVMGWGKRPEHDVHRRCMKGSGWWRWTQLPILDRVEAAFFDLDKTVIARPSMVAFGGPLRRDGLVSRRLLLRALWAQVIYLSLGADERRLARVRDAALRVSKGWEQRRIAALVRETLV